MNEAEVKAARRRARMSEYVNHPGVALRQLRECSGTVRDLADALESERAQTRKLSEFLRATAATLVAERRAS